MHDASPADSVPGYLAMPSGPQSDGPAQAFPGAVFEGAHRVLTRVMGLSYDPVATSDAWRRIFAFFDEHLGAGPGPGAAPGAGG